MKDLLEIYKPHARRWLEAEYSNEYSEQHVESLTHLLTACRADGEGQCEELADALEMLLRSQLRGPTGNPSFDSVLRASNTLKNYRGES